MGYSENHLPYRTLEPPRPVLLLIAPRLEHLHHDHRHTQTTELVCRQRTTKALAWSARPFGLVPNHTQPQQRQVADLLQNSKVGLPGRLQPHQSRTQASNFPSCWNPGLGSWSREAGEDGNHLDGHQGTNLILLRLVLVRS